MKVFWIAFVSGLAGSLLGKFLADAFLDRPLLLAGFGLTPGENTGIAFGMRFPPASQAAAIALAFAVVLVLAYRDARSSWHRAGYGLILAGALGNILDRLGDGAVTDFFRVGVFPIFNVADSLITIGVTTILLEIVYGRRKHGRK